MSSAWLTASVPGLLQRRLSLSEPGQVGQQGGPLGEDGLMIVLRLDGDVSAARVARAAVEDALSTRPEAVREIAVLLADELVTNALVHTSGEIGLSVEDSPEWIRVEVSDTSSATPLIRSPMPKEGRGRGMLIVDSLASSWGVVSTPEGKRVWFRINVAEREREP